MTSYNNNKIPYRGGYNPSITRNTYKIINNKTVNKVSKL
jgi:hypothetical protein